MGVSEAHGNDPCLSRFSQVREGGTARVVDVSLGDAHLAEIQLEKKTIPSELFRMVLEVDQEPLKDWRVNCTVVRLEWNGGLEADLQFERLSKSKQAMLEALMGGVKARKAAENSCAT